MTLSHQMSNGFLIIFEQEATLNEDPHIIDLRILKP
jgi:hypothetical protein